MPNCKQKWNINQGILNGKCTKFKTPSIWQGYNTTYKLLGKCKKPQLNQWYVRNKGAIYSNGSGTGPLGNPKANNYGPVLFEKSIPAYFWLNNAVKHGNANTRCKGQKRLKGCDLNTINSKTSTSSSSNVAPPFQSYETVLALRKSMAYYDTDNYKTYKKWKRSNCKN